MGRRSTLDSDNPADILEDELEPLMDEGGGPAAGRKRVSIMEPAAGDDATPRGGGDGGGRAAAATPRRRRPSDTYAHVLACLGSCGSPRDRFVDEDEHELPTTAAAARAPAAPATPAAPAAPAGPVAAGPADGETPPFSPSPRPVARMSTRHSKLRASMGVAIEQMEAEMEQMEDTERLALRLDGLEMYALIMSPITGREKAAKLANFKPLLSRSFSTRFG